MSLFSKNDRNKNADENRIKVLEYRIKGLEDSLLNARKSNEIIEKDKEQIIAKTRSFCHSLLVSDLAQQQLNNNNFIVQMNIYQLLDYTISRYREKLDEQKELLSSMLDKIKSKDMEIERLKGELSRYRVKEQVLIENAFTDSGSETRTNENQKNKGETSLASAVQKEHSAPQEKNDKSFSVQPIATSFVLDDEDMVPVVACPENQADDIEDVVVKASPIERKQTNKKQSSGSLFEKRGTRKSLKEPLVPIVKLESKVVPTNNEEDKPKVNIKEMVEKLSDVMWIIMTAIGEQGLSESKDIKKYTTDLGITEAAFNNALTQLRDIQIVLGEKINTGWRWFYAYEFSETGAKIFLEKYKKDIAVCEKQILKREHSTCLHGYCIKDTANILQYKNGYETVSTSREKNKVSLYNNTTYIPDIIASKKGGEVVDYFEVELGHHTQKDFNEKCNKMRQATRNLMFVVPDAETIKKINQQIEKYVEYCGGKEKLSGFSFYVTTTTKLGEGKYDTIHTF